MSELDEVTKEFLIESHENLDQLERDLVTLEKDPRNRDGLASIFRTVHTIKGTCGFFDFPKLGAVAHTGENLLGRLRDGELLLDADITTGLLALMDALRAMLTSIETSGRESDADYTDLIARLTKLQETPSGTVPLAHAEDKPVPAAHDAAAGNVAESSIRVDVALLDKLMTLVGELVLARNQILQFTSTQTDPVFLGTSQHLNLITTALQESVMKTRLLPIRNIWEKFPRLVRDLALACGKQVRLELDGKDTELDKSIIEAIKDPLTHLVRNAIDHGIETTELRLRRGKPAEGRLHLRAFHEGGQVNIEIADDGAGLDSERIKHKALERGLMSHDQAARLSDRDVLELIFLPGFSTMEAITSVSGRGVGMDVVKTNIERISGSIDLQSQPGRGTTVKIKIPLTLAIIPALLVSCDGDCYAVPQVNLRELIRLEASQARQKVEWIDGAPVYRLRGKLLPLVCLAHALQVQEQAFPTSAEVNIVVVQADDQQFGLVVDGVRDTAEIVVKPLGKPLKGVPVFAGATILGDGKVALILDVLGLAQRARMVSVGRDRARPETAASPARATPDRQALVLLSLGSNDYRLALPLAQVARLEEFPRTAVERTGERDVVQYRGRIMPLIDLARILPGEARAGETGRGPLQVVVYAHEGNQVGLVVDHILDVVETTAAATRSAASRPGILGTAIIQERVTDLLDVQGILRMASPSRTGGPL